MRLNRLGKVGARDGARALRPSLELNFLNGALPAGMTFTRASNATYFDAEGVLQWANANEHSGSATPTAGLSMASTPGTEHNITTGVPDAFGGNNAIRIEPLSPVCRATCAKFTAPKGSVATLSFWARSPTLPFTLTTAVIASPNQNVSFALTSEWQRYSVTYNLSTGDAEWFYPINQYEASSTVGAGKFVEICGVQLQLGTIAGEYLPTAPAEKRYTPRFTHDPETGEMLGLLTEAQRTNHLLRSNDLTNVAWTTVPAVPPVAGRPALTTAPSALVDLTGVGAFIRQTPSGLTPSGVYTFSVYVRAAAVNPASFIRLTTNNATQWNTGLSKKFPVTAEWTRIVLTGVLSDTSVINCMIGAIDQAANGDPTCNGKVELFGAQLEAGSGVTSLIMTGSAAATRAMEICSIPTAGWYAPEGGAFITEAIHIEPCTSDYPRHLRLESVPRTNIYMVYSVGGASTYSSCTLSDSGGVRQSNFGDNLGRTYGTVSRVLTYFQEGMQRMGTAPEPSATEFKSLPPSNLPANISILYVGSTSTGQEGSLVTRKISFQKRTIADHAAFLVELDKL